MSEQILVILKPEGRRKAISKIIMDHRIDGEATTLTSAINKVVADWVDKGAIPTRYRTK